MRIRDFAASTADQRSGVKSRVLFTSRLYFRRHPLAARPFVPARSELYRTLHAEPAPRFPAGDQVDLMTMRRLKRVLREIWRLRQDNKEPAPRSQEHQTPKTAKNIPERLPEALPTS